MKNPPVTAFTSFARETEPRLRQALVAAYGPELGVEAVGDALAWAWEHWERLQTTDNPAGYLYRIAIRRAWRRSRRRMVPVVAVEPATPNGPPWVEPGLTTALERLSRMQRLAVVLINGFGWTYQEVADFAGVSRATVQTHARRGMDRLRSEMKVAVDA